MKRIDKDCIIRELGSWLSPLARVVYLYFAGESVTWQKIQDQCGLSDHEIYLAWSGLQRVDLAEGDIARGGIGTIFEKSIPRESQL